MNEKSILILAGPNGAGKTTFARRFLPSAPSVVHFVNADLIALGLSPFRPDVAAFTAARLMLQRIDELVDSGHNFAFETTLSGHAYADHIDRWKSVGYTVTIYFLSLTSPEIAISRVAARVRQGGHDVPEDTVRRRFVSGRENFDRVYKRIVDAWALYDNSGPEPILLEWSESE